MRIGMVFHKNPYAPPVSIDLVRLRAIARGLFKRGVDTQILAPVDDEGILEGSVRVRPLSVLETPGTYDLLKTCYHHSILLVDKFSGAVVSRIVRVVDEKLPERDERFRSELLRCQDVIKKRARVVSLNNTLNRDRWNHLYGCPPDTILVPTGCPASIPPAAKNPFNTDKASVLFLGSLSAPRMVNILNEAARRLEGECTIHVVGSNKVAMYGGTLNCQLDHGIVEHGEFPENEIWDYIRHADIGLALAAGPHAFDNDLSKIISYLRGGLPVLSEEPVVQNRLLRELGFGRTFDFDDIKGLVSGARQILDNPPIAERTQVMATMIREHSWEQRVETYITLFRKILSDGL